MQERITGAGSYEGLGEDAYEDDLNRGFIMMFQTPQDGLSDEARITAHRILVNGIKRLIGDPDEEKSSLTSQD